MNFKNYKVRNINSKLVLININTSNDVMVFDGIAKIVLSKLIEGVKIEDIINNICIKYNQSYADIERDVYGFIEELKHLGVMYE